MPWTSARATVMVAEHAEAFRRTGGVRGKAAEWENQESRFKKPSYITIHSSQVYIRSIFHLCGTFVLYILISVEDK